MKSKKHEAQLPVNVLCYCYVCEKEMNFSSRLRHINSKTQKHEEKYGIVVKENEFIKPEIDETEYILDDVIEVCRDKFFHSLEYRLVCGVKFTNTTNIAQINLTSTHGYKCFKSEFYGLNKKSKRHRKMDLGLPKL